MNTPSLPGRPRADRRTARRLRAGLVVVVAAATCAGVPPALAQSAPVPAVAEPAVASAHPRLDALPALLGLPAALRADGDRDPAGFVAADAAGATTVGGAAQAAASYSTEVAAAGHRLRSFEFTRRAALGALLPKVDLRAAVGQGEVRTVEPAVRSERIDGLASGRMPLVDLASRRELGRQEALGAVAQEQLRDARSKAMLDGGLAFLSLMQARVGLALGARHEARLEELARYIGERAAAGGTSQSEAERLRSRVANARSALADNRAQLRTAVRNLERLQGLVPEAIAMVGFEPVDAAVPGDEGEAIARALRGNAEAAAARADLQALAGEAAVTRARMLPRLELEVTHTRARNPSGLGGATNDTKAMVVLSVNAFNGGSDQAQHRAALARRDEAEARLTGTERRLRLEVQTAYANLRAARERFVTVRDELDSNRRVVDAFQAQLVGGNRPLLDVLDAYQRLYQSQLDLTQVLVGHAQNGWRLSHLLGALPTDQPAAAAPN